MSKIAISNICSLGFIYRNDSPEEIFIEIKDSKYPREFARGQLCPLGGNWFGEEAKNDANTRSTFEREIYEELSFDRPMRDSSELSALGFSKLVHFDPAPMNQEATPVDVSNLDLVKKSIVNSALPFGDYLNILDYPDFSGSKHVEYLASYFTVGLEEDTWGILVGLQRKFGNLSSESLTLMTSLSEILEKGIKTAFAHDGVLQMFFRSLGLPGWKDLPIVPGSRHIPLGLPLPTYVDYLARYDIGRKPI